MPAAYIPDQAVRLGVVSRMARPAALPVRVYRKRSTMAAITVDQHPNNPCLNCGACYTAFRASFYWAEATERGLPDSSCGPALTFLACMNGANSATPRCCALVGDFGKDTFCSIYDTRPSPCREVSPG